MIAANKSCLRTGRHAAFFALIFLCVSVPLWFRAGAELSAQPPVAAKDPIIIDIWPGKPAGDVGITGEEKFFEFKVKGKPYLVDGKPTKWLTNVTRPTLTIYRPAKDKDTG